LGEQIIHEGNNSYDWQFGFVTGQADSSVMTAQWSVRRLGGELSAGHADALQLEECVNQAFVNNVTPNQGLNNETLPVIISGGGFTGTPTVFRTKQGVLIPATVTNVTTNHLTVELPLTGLGSGKYDLLVKQGGCITTVSQGFAVVAQGLINGSFESPDAPQTA